MSISDMPAPAPVSKKGKIILLSISVLICIAASIILYISWTQDQIKLKEKGQPDLNTLTVEQLEDGLYIKGTVDLVLCAYAEEYEATKFGRTSESKVLYYLIPVSQKDPNGYYNIKFFLTLKAYPNDFDALNRIVQQTWSDSAEQAAFTLENGQIFNLPLEIRGYLNKWAEDPDFYEGGSFIDWCAEQHFFETDDEETIKSKIVPFMVIRTITAGTNIGLIWISGGIAIVLIITLLIIIFRGRYLKRKDVNPYRNEWEEYKDQ